MKNLLALLPNPMKALSPEVLGVLAAAVVITAAVFALMRRLRKFEMAMAQTLARLEAAEERYRHAKEKTPESREAPAGELRREIETLHAAIVTVPADTARLLEPAFRKMRDDASATPPRLGGPRRDQYDEPEDGLAQLLAIANRIVQQSSATLDDFRITTGALTARVAAWPGSADGAPLAFIVEYRGQHYAVPNVVKPARLPKEWFNRSEFGFNDEIRRVVSLPRLRRVGDRYDVQEAGVFGR